MTTPREPTAADPPFGTLVGSDDPALPFDALTYSDAAPPAKRTMADQWHDLGPKKQKLVLAVALVGMTAGAFAFQDHAEAVKPVKAADIVPKVPDRVDLPPEKTYRLVSTKVAIKASDRVTSANVGTFFKVVPAKVDEPGVIGDMNKLIDLWPKADLQPGQLIRLDLFCDYPPVVLAPAPRVKVAPPPPTVIPPARRKIAMSTPGGTYHDVFEEFAPPGSDRWKRIGTELNGKFYPLP